MSLQFACRACGDRHPSRLRIPDPDLLRSVMHAFGEVLEPCPATGRWMPVRFGDLSWETTAAAAPFQTVAGGV